MLCASKANQEILEVYDESQKVEADEVIVDVGEIELQLVQNSDMDLVSDSGDKEVSNKGSGSSISVSFG
jgi:hypothetical protein